MKLSHLLLLSVSLFPFQAQAMDPNEIVEHVYDRTITYSPGPFTPYKEGLTTFSTQPQAPQAAYTQRTLSYEITPQEFTREKVLKQVIPGQDGRTRVAKTTDWPHSICTQLSMTFKGKVYGGTGAFVGPQQILTCGHNVYDSDEKIWAEEILAYPALNDAHAPFGEVKVTKVYTLKGWVSQGKEDLDMALLILNKPIGKHTGWGGLLSLDDTSLVQEKVHITGYPGDKGLKQMWTMGHTLKTIKPEQFYYEIDTAGGQSGSPIWINKWGMPMILGVHTTGSNSINSGVRLSGQKFTNFLIKAISETYVLDAVPTTALASFSLGSSSGGQQTLAVSPSMMPKPTTIPQQIKSTIPDIARGHEAIYERFLKGVLIYRPTEGSNEGKIELPIAALANPLEGTFDLSRCGNAGKYLSISTGYRKGYKAENANKLEIWFAPWFLVDKEKSTMPSHHHLQSITKNWDAAKAPVGIFWTWGGWNGAEHLQYCDYLVTESMDKMGDENISKKWTRSELGELPAGNRAGRKQALQRQRDFTFHF